MKLLSIDVNIECPDIQNATWTDPGIIGGDSNTITQCNQSAGYHFPVGNSTVECKLYGKPDGKGEPVKEILCHVAVPVLPGPVVKNGMSIICVFYK